MSKFPFAKFPGDFPVKMEKVPGMDSGAPPHALW
jgi:hypothetical protein